MKKRGKTILWVLLIISLLFSTNGIILRTNNEKVNHSVITTADYREFQTAANNSNYDLEAVLDRLQESGVTHLTIKETTIRDLENQGKITVSTWAEFNAGMQTADPELAGKIIQSLPVKEINPVNLVITPINEKTAAFIAANLSKRLSNDELITIDLAGKQVFLINVELPQPVSADGAVKKPDLRIGFDKELIEALKSKGFEIVLSPGNNTGSNKQFIREYSEIVQRFDIKYIIFDGMEISGYPDDIESMQQVITDNDLILGIIETSQQLGYLNQVGIDELMYNCGYPINRVYSTRNDEYLKEVDERYYRWLRAVIDRGIRIVYLVPFQNEKINYSVNLEDTLETADRFHQTIEEKGFNVNQPLNKMSAAMPDKFDRLAVSITLLLGSLLYLSYIFRMRKSTWLILSVLGILACLGINLFLNTDFTKIYALGAAVLYPSLSSLLALYYWRDNRQRPIWQQITVSLAIILGVNAIGMYTIVTSLADITYIMNVEYFRGVKVAFIVPLVMFVINYLVVYQGVNGIKKFLTDFLKTSPSYFILGLSLLGLMGIYLYLARSGNTSGVAVSSLELRIREILETIFIARPRFKEIIIGYPALFALIYLYHKYKNQAIVFILGLGVVMGSISMVNSFSHVFTAVIISAQRTLAGLLVGVIAGIMTIMIIWIGERLYQSWQ
ncbi:MAG TPA: DUF5693 family protein [Syntrophomonadaceae bacterium]|nr:DUF5693 family protein [Syntrophomonadaceae bacterium]HPR93310.1 DUF5693 family protein [Syntrophomonadaceae bacterium]